MKRIESSCETRGLPGGCPWALALLCGLLASACGAAVQHPDAARGSERDVVAMDELRITAGGEGDAYRGGVYDASDLFKDATALLNEKKCREAVVLYDRLVREFPEGRYTSAALYNAGLCLQALGDFAESAARYQQLLSRPQAPEADDDHKDAAFQLTEVLVQLERWTEVIELAEKLLLREDLSADERLEAMARKGQGLLGLGELEQAERHARSSLSYYRTRPPEAPIKDDFFAAASNYVLAESYRLRAEAMAFPEGLEPQKKVLIRRAELLLEAQREYFKTVQLNNLDNYHWAAASGYRIGYMYDELWSAIMSAPIPAHLPPEGHSVYREELAKLVKPLVRHAIRYWELTLMFIERTGLQGSWADKTRSDLERVRALLLQQPAGPGGLPGPEATDPGTAPPSAEAVPQAARELRPGRDRDRDFSG
ncbi:MAG: hypothetical protein OEZ06_28750 [Myxococcales bacterium]|nr:hypothetical protein [Myxococcales bacterium]